MKNIFLKFVCFLIMISVALSYSFGASALSWYTVPTKGGKRPSGFESEDILKDYDVIYLGSPEAKKIYLTFDAGYENGNVEKVLDTLKKHDVPAAFFILPHMINAQEELVLRMANEGHLVCNHSYSHKNMSNIKDKEQFKSELTKLEELYKEKTGLDMAKYYRPPEGSFSIDNLALAKELGYKTVFWSLAYADWDNKEQMPCDKAKSIILSRMHNGCVLLLHPTSSTNALILDELITTLKNDGYEFASLDDFEE